MTPCWGNTFLFRPLPRLCLGPLKGYLSWHCALQGLSTCLLGCIWNYRELRTQSCARHGCPKTLSKITDPSLDWVFVSKPFLTQILDWEKQQKKIELVTWPGRQHRIPVGHSIDGLDLSPGITKEQRLEVEGLMKKAFAKMTGDLAGTPSPGENYKIV